MKPIQVEPHPDHNRTLVFTDLPQKHPNDLQCLKVTIDYAEEDNEGGRLDKAIALDSHVIPAIHHAFRDQTLLWGVLNAVRVVLKFNQPNAMANLQEVLPRIEQVLERTDHTKHDGTV